MPDPLPYLDRLNSAERDGLELLDTAIRHAGDPRQREALGAITAIVLEVARRRDARAAGDVVEWRTVDTLDAARATLREELLATVELLTDPAGERALGAGPLERARELNALADAYVKLGGDLELDQADRALEAELRVRELEDAGRAIDTAIMDAGPQGTAILTEGVLEPLGAALRAFYELRTGRTSA